MTSIPDLHGFLLFGGSDRHAFYDDIFLLFHASESGDSENESLTPHFEWKKLSISHESMTTYLDQEGAFEYEQPLLPGCARFHHKMHYISTCKTAEEKNGYRVLVIGNPLMAAADDNTEEVTFENESLRVEQLYIQNMGCHAQWTPLKVS